MRTQSGSLRRRITQRVDRIMDPEDRYNQYRNHTRAETRAFLKELAETGVDIGGGPYPVRRSVAFRGPELPIEGPWLNGMLLDETPPPPRPFPYADPSSYYHAYYYNQRPEDYYSNDTDYDDDGPAAPRRGHGHGYSRRYAAARPHAQQHQHQHQQPRRRRRQTTQRQQQQPRRPRPRQMTAEEIAAERLARENASALSTALVIVHLDTLDEERAAAATAAAAVDYEPDDGYSRARTASASEEEREQGPRVSRPRPWEYDPNEPDESASEEDSEDGKDWVDASGVPIPPRDKVAERKERRARRALQKELYIKSQQGYSFTEGPLSCAKASCSHNP